MLINTAPNSSLGRPQSIGHAPWSGIYMIELYIPSIVAMPKKGEIIASMDFLHYS
jgi:hypothetical protein